MAAVKCASAAHKPIQIVGISNTLLPDDVSAFFIRFETDNSTQLRTITSTLGAAHPVLIISSAEVVRGLKMTKSNTAPGLWAHTQTLCWATGSVPSSVPATKSPQYGNIPQCSPSTKKDTTKALRPVAFTSLIMKAMEKIMKNHLTRVTDLMWDPLQFA